MNVVKIILNVIKNENVDDIYSALDIFKNNNSIFEPLILQMVRLEFNEAFKKNEKKEYIDSKKILLKCQSILNYYEFPSKFLLNQINDNCKDEYKDLKEKPFFKKLVDKVREYFDNTHKRIYKTKLTNTEFLNIKFIDIDLLKKIIQKTITVRFYSDRENENECLSII